MVVLKIQFGDDIRRLSVNSPLNFKSLKDLAANLFQTGNQEFVFKYSDDEGDVITISTDLELNEALRLVPTEGILKLTLVPNASKKEEDDKDGEDFVKVLEELSSQFLPQIFGQQRPACPAFAGRCGQNRCGQWQNRCAQWQNRCGRSFASTEQELKVHPATCDGCNQSIVDVRFKCNKCPDYDLCQNCIQVEGVHEAADHSFVKITDPRAPIHPAICDSCSNLIVGLRFKCDSCIDYDLCETCIQKKGVHDETHKFSRLQRPFGFAGGRCPGRRWGHCRGAQGCPKQEESEVPQETPKTEEPAVETQKEETKQETKEEEVAVPVATPVAAPIQVPISVPVQVQKETKEEENTPSTPSTPTQTPRAPSSAPSTPSTERNNNKTPNLFETKLKQLEEMGFTDRKQNIALLLKNKLDMVQTVKDLLDH